jgi:hypothetical protein
LVPSLRENGMKVSEIVLSVTLKSKTGRPMKDGKTNSE